MRKPKWRKPRQKRPIYRRGLPQAFALRRPYRHLPTTPASKAAPHMTHSLYTSPTVSQEQIKSEHKTPIKTGWSLARWLFTALLAMATLIGGGVVFWPRVTVEASGDLSNPATIQFVATNTGYVSLRHPAMGMVGCELAYGKEPSTPMRKCLTSSFPPEVLSETGYRWLNMDEKFTTRLEDWIAFTDKSPKLYRVNVLIRFSYYPLVSSFSRL